MSERVTTPVGNVIRGVSLFAGAGGMDLGFRLAGVTTAVAVEMEPNACASFRVNHPEVELWEGRIEERGEEWGPLEGTVDVVFGGPPCQPFSSAGKGRGAYDPRDGMPHFIEVVRRLRPRAFVFENVEALTFDKHRAYLFQVIGDLAGLGYAVGHRVLNAAYFGVPQIRHRLFVVGMAGPAEVLPMGHNVRGFAWPEPTHGNPAELGGMFEERLPWATVRQALNLRIEHRPNRDIREGRPSTSWDFDDRPSTAVAVFQTLEVPEPEPDEYRYMKMARGAETSNMPNYPTDRPSIPIAASVIPFFSAEPLPVADKPAARHPEADPDQEVMALEAAIDEAELVRFEREGLEPVSPDAPSPTVRPASTGSERWGDLLLRRHRGVSQERPDSSVDDPSPAVLADTPSGRSGLYVVMSDPGRTIDDVDAPSPTVRAAGEDARPGHTINGGNPLYLRHRSETAHDGRPTPPTSVDGPSPAVSSSSTLYLEPAEGQLDLLAMTNGITGADPVELDLPARTIDAHLAKDPPDLTSEVARRQRILERRRAGDPKHPPSSPDEPAKAITSGGDGHSNHDHLLELEDLPACVCGHDYAAHDLERFLSEEGCGACDCDGYRPAADERLLDRPAPTISTGGEQGGRGVVAKAKRDELFEALGAAGGGEPAGAAPARRTRADAIADGTLDPAAAYGRAAYGRAAGGLHKGERIVEADAPAQAVQAAAGGQDFVRGLVDDAAPSPTVTAHAEEPVGQGSRQAVRRGYYRRLRPDECAILQAFPPYCHHPEHGWREGEAYVFKGSKSAVYRQVGNAVPPPLARAVAAQLVAALTKEVPL